MRASLARHKPYTHACAFGECLRAVGQPPPGSHSPHELLSFTTKQILHRRHNRSPVPRRDLHTTQRQSTAEQATSISLSNDAPPEYSFSIGPKTPKGSRDSQIRKSLQQWSTQNTRMKEAQTPEAIPYDGKVRNLPNAIFVGYGRNVVDDEPDGPSSRNSRLVNSQEDEELVEPQAEVIQPGTMRTILTKLIPKQNAIYLGEIGIQSLFLLSNGKWAAIRLQNKRFGMSIASGVMVPNFISANEVQHLLSYTPKRDVVRAVGQDAAPVAIDATGSLPDEVISTILPKLKAFNDEENRFWRKHRTQMENMYDNLAFEERWRNISIQDLPRLVLNMDYEAMTLPERKAFVHYAFRIHPLVVATQTAATIIYYFGPKKINRDISSVETWARSYQEAAAQAAMGKNVSDLLRNNPLSGFIDKARRIISKSRRIRTPTSLGILGPVNEQAKSMDKTKLSTGEEFTNEDKAIVNYLYDLALRRPISTHTMAHASLIVRAVGAYPGMELSLNSYRMLLQEIGCADPWTTFEDIAVPLPGRRASHELDQLCSAAQDSVKELAGAEAGPSGLPDTLSNIRKDWGEMLAFCIDKPGATNIEDAISLEPATEIKGGYWLHTHLAHPTAHLGLDHPVVQFARKRGSAYYGIVDGVGVQTMVPTEIIRRFAIQNGRPVLTISTLLTMDGQVHDVKIGPGLLRNVKFINLAAFLKAMGAEDVEQAILVVGNTSRMGRSNRPDKTKFDDRVIAEISRFMPQFELMSQLLSARRTRRMEEVENPASLAHTTDSMMSKVSLPESYTPYREAESYHWKGDPDIMIRGNRKFTVMKNAEEHRGQDTLSQAMRLASESLGKWLSDRNIPAVFLGSTFAAGVSIQEMEAKGPHAEVAKPLFTRTSYPRPLYGRNMRQNAPCTSPMRIFHDMFNHFQVDSYLKAEAQGLIQPGQPVRDDTILAFSRTAVEEYLSQDSSFGDHIDDLSRTSRTFWALQAVFRAFHFKEANLPETLEAVIKTQTRRDATGNLEPATAQLIPWGLPVTLEPSAEGYENTAGIKTFLPIKIINVDPYRMTIFARAVGRPTTEQQIFDPIQCNVPHDTLNVT